MKKLGIYIHIPFCVKKCQYCDFLSFGVGRSFAGSAMERDYIEALIKEIESEKETEDWVVDTVFFGGGTPSVVSPLSIEKVLCKLHEKYQFADCPEITMEVNPGTVTEKSLFEYRKMGINRLSIGMQSANEEELVMLGRIHSKCEVEETVHLARAAGFQNLSLDLMSSLPDQTAAMFRESLEKAITLSVEHLSIYSLIIEEGTPFYRKRSTLNLPKEEEVDRIDQSIEELTHLAAYHHYEISNYAKEGFCCRHNLKYWNRDSYRGFGVGAASLMEYEDGRHLRFTNSAKIEQYREECMQSPFARKGVQEYRLLSEHDRMEEYMFLGLRLVSGISLSKFEKIFSVTMEEIYKTPINKYLAYGMLQKENRNNDVFLSFTKRGMEMSNDILTDFLF